MAPSPVYWSLASFLTTRPETRGDAHFTVITGEPLPIRYGIIQYRTAKEYNNAEIGAGWPIILFGALIAGAGLLGLMVYIMARGFIFDAWKREVESVREQWRHDK